MESIKQIALMNMEKQKHNQKNCTRGDRSFAIAAPHLWNELPLNIRTAKSIAVFKKLLKTTPYVKNIL